MAFSMAWVSDLSNGWTVSRRASGAATMATWLSGIVIAVRLDPHDVEQRRCWPCRSGSR